MIVNPFFHMFGYKAGCLASLMRGATIIPKPVFEVDDLLRTVAEESVTVFPGPPTVYQSILDHPDRDRHDLSSLRLAVTGAADIPVELIRRMHEELPFSPDRHRVRAHRSGHGHGHRARRRLRDHRHHRRSRATGPRDPRGGRRRRRGPDGRGGRAAGARLQRDARVPRRSRRDRSHDRRRRLVAHRRPRAPSTSAGACASSDGSRTCSSSAGSTPTRPRSRTCCSGTRPSRGRPSSACPTPAWARSAWRSSWSTPGSELDADELIAWARDAMANYKVPRAVELVDELPVNAAGKVEKETLRARAAARRVEEAEKA